MMRKKKTKLTAKLLKYLMLVSSITVIIIGSFWIYDIYNRFKDKALSIEQIQMDYIKKDIYGQVNTIINYIQFRRAQVDKVMREDLKEKTYEAYDIINSIYEENKDIKTKKEIEDIIKAALRDVRFNDGRGYYFVDTLEGDVILYPVYPQSEGTNIIDLQDDLGNYALREEISLVKTQGEGYITGYWRMPDSNDEKTHEKITFVKKFEPYDWYFGCGEYVENVIKDTQEELLNYVNSTQYGVNGQQYIFVHNYKGIELANGMYPQLIGVNNWELEDINGIKVCQEQVKIATEQQDGGYLLHYWQNANGIGSYEKLTYVRAVPEWEWVVGTGQDTELIKKMISEKSETLKKDVLTRIVLILGILILVVMLAFLQSKYLVKILKHNIDVFVRFMNDASERFETVDVDKISYQDFAELAETANSMTQKINMLLSYDDLTKVYNRKQMYHLIESCTEKCQIDSSYNAVMLMIDLDHFKRINDDFGHQTGDLVLKEVAKTIKNTLGQEAILGRYGGEEFIAILHGNNLKDGQIIAERVRVAVEEIHYDNEAIKTTVSIGLCLIKDGDVDAIINEADVNLYKAKSLGRNCIYGA